MRISDWSSDVCSSDLGRDPLVIKATRVDTIHGLVNLMDTASTVRPQGVPLLLLYGAKDEVIPRPPVERFAEALQAARPSGLQIAVYGNGRSEEHTAELQSLKRISSAVFCL